MAGLLDFAFGFGVSAAGAYAQQQKQDIASIREANLARIRAQYKKDQMRQEQQMLRQEEDRLTDLVGRARGGDEEAQNRLDALGRNWRVESEAPRDLTKNEQLVMFGELQREDPQRARQFAEVYGLDYEDMTGQRSEEDRDPDFTNMVNADGDVKVVDKNNRLRVQELSDQGYAFSGTVGAPTRRSSAEDEGESIARTESGELDLDALPANMPNFDVIELGTGPGDAFLGTLLGIPYVGSAIASTEAGKRGSYARQARNEFASIKKEIIDLEKTNEGRVSNFDIEQTMEQVPDYGALSTGEASFADFQSVTNRLGREMKRLDRRARGQSYYYNSEETQQAARELLNELGPKYQRLRGYMDAYAIGQTNVNGKPIRNMSYEELLEVARNPSDFGIGENDQQKAYGVLRLIEYRQANRNGNR